MKPLSFIRRTLIGLLGTALGMVLLVVAGHADEVPGASLNPLQPAIVIHPASTTQSDYCRLDADGRTWLVLPGGERFELVASVDDPAILNKGDGSFHPFDASVVREAIAAVTYPLDGLKVEIFILPFPRRDGLVSAAGPGVIFLSPGVRALSVDQQHAETIHELGHVVQYEFMPDVDRASWETYRTLRGIEDTGTYWSGAMHADRPHEIFAEDFRALFGDAAANYSGTIENAALTYPTQVQGLRSFMLGLAGSAPRSIALSAWPNPTRGATTFSRSGTAPSMLDLFDAQGRRIATVTPATGPAGIQWVWDGRDSAGRHVGPGVLFARAREPRSRTIRVTLLP